MSFPLGHPRSGAAGGDAALPRARPDLELDSEVTFTPPDAVGPACGVLAHLGYGVGHGCACAQPGSLLALVLQLPACPEGRGRLGQRFCGTALSLCISALAAGGPSTVCWCPLLHPEVQWLSPGCVSAVLSSSEPRVGCRDSSPPSPFVVTRQLSVFPQDSSWVAVVHKAGWLEPRPQHPYFLLEVVI